ncbi:MAG: fimbrillin family protein, partial [Prevotella sp.]|nr:fimbrillin family protein [Prevotella sp.]
MTFNKTIARLLPLTWMLAVLVSFTACNGSDEAVTETPVTPSNKNVAVTFNTYVQSGNTQTRATYPSEAASGSIDINRLKALGFGVFAQHTSNTEWTSYSQGTPFNFMWNQQVTWDGTSAWTYSPVKYWPNDNNPADNAGATGSQYYSYLSFFAYAPYAPVATPASGFDVKDVDENSDGKPDHDGIVAVSLNNANANASYLYYRTSLEKPFGIDKSVDLLWTNQRDLYKMKESGEGNVDGRVSLNFKHALTKLDINVRAMVDNTASASSPAYSTEVDGNTRIYIDNVSIT